MSYKIKFLAALLIFSFGMTAQSFAYSVSYDQTVTLEKSVIATIKVLVQDDKMSAQSNFSGMDSVILRNETGTYSYMPDQKMATKIPAAMDRPNLTRDLPRFMEFLKQNNGKKIGSENLAGRDCDIYQFTEPSLKQDAKAWVWTEKSFPVKIEVPSPEGLTTIELTNIQFDPVIPPAQFQLPADVKVIDLETTQPVAPPQENPTPKTADEAALAEKASL